MLDSYALVESALEHLWDHAYLGRHPLVGVAMRRMPTESSRPTSFLARGRIFSQFMQECIGELRMPEPNGHLSREKYYHDILFYCYVRGETNGAVAERLDISPRTFYRYRRQAIEAMVQLLEDSTG
ncbi:MAG: hypothetical protein HZB53_06070 [Chloroflexi bacterium]|nr:hypothetical protein [Chloroflexota bacterium]